MEQSGNVKACKTRKHDEIDDTDKTDEEANEKKPENVGQYGNLKACKKRKHDEIDDTDKTNNEEENEKKPENVGHNGNLKACTKRKHDASDVDNKICDGKNNCNRRNNNMGQTDIKTRGKCKYCFVTIHKMYWCIIVAPELVISNILLGVSMYINHSPPPPQPLPTCTFLLIGL